MPPTPMMQQYQQAKQAAGDALLLFRMGDFYELFFDDAKLAAGVLGLTLTSRDKGDNPIPMAGFPHHQLQGYLAKIIAAGHRAAICEQVEDPKLAKGLVRRELTRIVSPGTLTDDEMLDPQTSNYLAAVAIAASSGKADQSDGLTGLAWIDVSTGEFQATALERRHLPDHLARIGPTECLVSDAAPPLGPDDTTGITVTRRPAWAFGHAAARQVLEKHFGTHSLEGFGFGESEPDSLALAAAGAVLDYLSETQKASLGHVDRLLPFSAEATLQIDPATRRSLEITETLRHRSREGSLLGVIDRTVTAMGARLLAAWLAAPLTDLAAINARLDAVAELLNGTVSADLRESLRRLYDLERLLARVATGRATPRDLGAIARTLTRLPKIKAKLAGRTSHRLRHLEDRIELCPELRAALEAALADELPIATREGGILRSGYDARLDELRELRSGGKQWMAAYQAEQVKLTGITSLKVGFNKVFGYYLEVTHAHRDKVPAGYTRKQTLKNAERYITPELKEYEEKVLSAEERANELEYELFVELRSMVAAEATRIRRTAEALAEVDVLAGLAELARQRQYVRPTMTDRPVLEIVDGRHPVLDVTEPEGTFVPNSVSCAARTGASASQYATNAEVPPSRDETQDSKQPAPGSVLLITGPNMAGKSTYIRQAALLTLLAQIGSFVPARQATIGVADRIFARVGASDELSRGQSTFMVEMVETARILHTASERSLVILDEIGRGTSTYDGLSLAWSIVEHVHDVIGCRTLFATHYHELTDLADRLPGVRNWNVAVREWEDRVVFLHQVVPGAADKSYGIHVAQLAGVPPEVNRRAQEVLAWLEAQHDGLREGGDSQRLTPPKAASNGRPRRQEWQMTLFEVQEHPLLGRLRELNLDTLTPIEALQLVASWQRELAAAADTESSESRQD